MLSVEREKVSEILNLSAERAIQNTPFSEVFNKQKTHLTELFARFLETLNPRVDFENITEACEKNYLEIFEDFEKKLTDELVKKEDYEKMRSKIRKNIKILIRETATDYFLRQYQIECLESIQNAIDQGKKTCLIQLPTGTGKTIAFSFLQEYLGIKGKMLVLAHRDQLLKQADDKIRKVNPELETTILSGKSKKYNFEANVIIGSVPALGQKGSKKLLQIDPSKICIVITDEAHHATADTYTRIFEYLRESNDEILHVGFTATPIRSDKQDLKQVYPELTYSMSLRQAIQEEWLARIIGYRVNTKTDLSNVASGIGDLNQAQLGEVVNTEERNQKVIDAYLQHANNKKTLVFAVDIQHSKDLVKKFTSTNVKAVHVDGNTPDEELEKYFKQLKEGKLNVMVNCSLLTEGFDCPELEAIIMARPTESALLYEQMLGRGTRKIKGIKEEMVLIDLVDNSQRHALIDAAKLFGITGKKKEGDLVDLKEHEDKEEEIKRIAKMKKKQGFDSSEKMDFFRDYPEIENSDVFFVGQHGSFRVYLPDQRVIHLGMDILGNWTTVFPNNYRKSFDNLQEAVKCIEIWLNQNAVNLKHFWHKKHLEWMEENATERQLSFLQKIIKFVEKAYPQFLLEIKEKRINKKNANIILSDYTEKQNVRGTESKKTIDKPASQQQLYVLNKRLKTLRRIKPGFTLEDITSDEAWKAVKYCKDYDMPEDDNFIPESDFQVDMLAGINGEDKRKYFSQLPYQEAKRLLDNTKMKK